MIGDRLSTAEVPHQRRSQAGFLTLMRSDDSIEVARSTTVHLRISEAKQLPVMDKTPLISQHSCDAFCSLRVDNQEVARTATKWRTLCPFWGEDFTLHMPRGFQNISIYVYNENHLGSNDLIGKVSLDRRTVRLSTKGMDGWFPLEPANKDDEVQGDVEVAMRLLQAPLQLKVEIIQARSLASKDASGKADPFVSFTMNGQVYRTQVVKRTRFPVWQQPFTIPLEHPPNDEDTLKLTVWNWDRLSRNSFLGEVNIPLNKVPVGKAKQHWHRLTVRQHTREEKTGLGSIRLRAFVREHMVLPPPCYWPFINLFLQSVQRPWKHCINAITLLEEVMTVNTAEIAAVLVRLYLAQCKVVDFLDMLVDAELRESEKSTLFRGNTLTTKAYDHFMKLVGNMYLREVLQPVIDQVFEEKKDTEIDPAKLDSGSLNNTSLVVEAHVAQLSIYISRAVDAILCSAKDCPPVMRLAFKRLLFKTRKRFVIDQPDNKDVHYLAVSGFIFLRFFVPAIVSPKLFLLREEHAGKTVARTLTLMAKAIQSMANLGEGLDGTKEGFMSLLYPLIAENVERVKFFLDELVAIPEELADIESRYYRHWCIIREGAMPVIKGQRRTVDLTSTSRKQHVWLTRSSLQYAKTSKSADRHTVDCEKICAVEKVDPEVFHNSNVLQVIVQQHDNSHICYYFIAKDVNEKQQWLSSLRKVCLSNPGMLQTYHSGVHRRGRWTCCQKEDSHALGCCRTHSGAILGDFQDPLDPEADAQLLFTQLWNGFDHLTESYCPDREFPSATSAEVSSSTLQKIKESVREEVEDSYVYTPPYVTRTSELYYTAFNGYRLRRFCPEPKSPLDPACQTQNFSGSSAGALEREPYRSRKSSTSSKGSVYPFSSVSPNVSRGGVGVSGIAPVRRSTDFNWKETAASPKGSLSSSNTMCVLLLDEIEKLHFSHVRQSQLSRHGSIISYY